MGYIKHKAVLVTTWKDCKELDYFIDSQEPQHRRLFHVTERVTNGYLTYFMAPDGSKEGWKESDDAERIRADFIKIAMTIPCVNIVYVSYGGDYGSENGTTVDFTTDQPYENEE